MAIYLNRNSYQAFDRPLNGRRDGTVAIQSKPFHRELAQVAMRVRDLDRQLAWLRFIHADCGDQARLVGENHWYRGVAPHTGKRHAVLERVRWSTTRDDHQHHHELPDTRGPP